MRKYLSIIILSSLSFSLMANNEVKKADPIVEKYEELRQQDLENQRSQESQEYQKYRMKKERAAASLLRSQGLNPDDFDFKVVEGILYMESDGHVCRLMQTRSIFNFVTGLYPYWSMKKNLDCYSLQK